MDLSHPQSNLSLGFHSYAAAAVGGDSIPRSRSQSFPFQSLNEKPDNRSDDEQQSRDEEQRKEEFSMLGHPICPKKRQRRYESSSSYSSAKKLVPDSDHETRRSAVRSSGNQPLSAADPDLFDIMENERRQQTAGIKLIASENFVCCAVLEALGSHLTNKYSKGMSGAG